jgi:hypothetical protein
MRLGPRDDAAFAEGEAVGRVVPEVVPRACASSASRNVLSASGLTEPIGSI